MNNDYPECSGNPKDCPENEGYGCCNKPVISETESEVDTVSTMIKLAHEQGLLVEVVWSAMNATGTIAERCNAALLEWDI